MTTTHASFTVSPPGYQLPADISIGRVVLQVANLERSLAYYERVVGLRAIAQSATRATLGALGSGEVLVELREKAGINPVPSRGRLGLYHFALLLPSRAALGQFLAHLARINEYAGMADHLVSEALYLTDPDGLGIEVYADRPRETWRTTGSAIAMATDPLDVRDLLAVGSAQEWQGMPAGTRVGHVHLYVDALEKSAAFFHDALGFDKIVLQFPGALFLSAGGYHHHLGTNIWAARAPLATNADARLVEWGLNFPDASAVREAVHSLESAGHVIETHSRGATVSDPWGTRIALEAPE